MDAILVGTRQVLEERRQAGCYNAAEIIWEQSAKEWTEAEANSGKLELNFQGSI